MQDVFIALSVIGFTLTVLSPYFFNRYTKYKLEKEKMRLESEIRKEEIRAKNQFNIEKYMADEQLKAGSLQAQRETQPVMPQETDILDDGRGRERIRY